ncbi:MAG TPA: hypothetical protein VFE10_13800 [Phenylobacterium sp.]|jgi:hypothetical protein|nr:hypothetical protein [Phenylobacterium sp.]
MTARIVLVALACALAGCTQAARSASYFEAHTGEATEIVKACATGAARGEECLAAQTGLNAAARDARMAAERRLF